MLFRLNFLFLRGVSRKRNGSELFSVFVVSVSPCPFVFTAFSSLSLFFPPILDLSPKLMLLLRGLAQMPSRGLFPTALFDGSVIQCLYGSELRNRLEHWEETWVRWIWPPSTNQILSCLCSCMGGKSFSFRHDVLERAVSWQWWERNIIPEMTGFFQIGRVPRNHVRRETQNMSCTVVKLMCIL